MVYFTNYTFWTPHIEWNIFLYFLFFFQLNLTWWLNGEFILLHIQIAIADNIWKNLIWKFILLHYVNANGKVNSDYIRKAIANFSWERASENLNVNEMIHVFYKFCLTLFLMRLLSVTAMWKVQLKIRTKFISFMYQKMIINH